MHGAGGALLQSLKALKLHFDIRPGDRMFYFCTTNWVVWNMLFHALAAEATVMMYDGSPFERNGKILFDYAEKERITPFRHLGEIHRRAGKARHGARSKRHPLPELRMIISTGSPLVAESYDYVYAKVKADVCLASISGGTDMMAAFADANPVLPVYRGEMQCRSLGTAVEVWNEAGEPVVGREGRAGLRQAAALDAARLLERQGRREIPQRLLREISRRVDATATGPSSPSAAP